MKVRIIISVILMGIFFAGCSNYPVGNRIFKARILKSEDKLIYIDLGSDDALKLGGKFNVQIVYDKITNSRKKVIFEKKKIIGTAEVSDLNKKSSELKVNYHKDTVIPGENEEIELITL